MGWGADTWAAIASAVAAVFSAITALVVARRQPRWQAEVEEERQRRANRRQIKAFIEEVSEAFERVYAKAAFDNLEFENDPARLIEDAVNYPKTTLSALEKCRQLLTLFDEGAADRMSSAMRTIDKYVESCRRISTRLRQPVDGNEMHRQLVVFAGLRGQVLAAVDSIGRDLVAYGAEPRAWHGLHDPDPIDE